MRLYAFSLSDGATGVKKEELDASESSHTPEKYSKYQL